MPKKSALLLLVIALFTAAMLPPDANAWGGKPWNAMHDSINCELKIDPMLGDSVYGQIECPEQQTINSYHPAFQSETFTASQMGLSKIQFTLRPGLARLGGRHGAMSCSGSWERSMWGSASVDNRFGVHCQTPGHPDIACVDFDTPSSVDFTDWITLRCDPMEYSDGKKWMYWDVGHGFSASIVLDKLSGGRARVKIMDLPDVTTVKFIFYSLSTKKNSYKTVSIAGDRAVVTMPKKGRYYVSVVVGTVTSERILVVR